MQAITNFLATTQPYELLLLDLWGVIHDGQELYPNVKNTLAQLREQGKKMVFISNAPRRSAVAQAKLDHLGIDRAWYDAIITSGEVTRRLLTDTPEALPFPVSNHYAFIGPERDSDLLDGTSYKAVVDWKDASFILNLGFDDDDLELKNYLPQLDRGISLKLPMICANPDDIIVRLDGSPFPCAGLLAERYEMMGGTVMYVGKPHVDIYTHALAIYPEIKATNILAIGDNMHTDIAGATHAGVDSMLITGGVLSFKTNATTSMDDVIAREIKKHHVQPTFTAPAFRTDNQQKAA